MFTPKYMMVFDHDITLESLATILITAFDLVAGPDAQTVTF